MTGIAQYCVRHLKDGYEGSDTATGRATCRLGLGGQTELGQLRGLFNRASNNRIAGWAQNADRPRQCGHERSTDHSTRVLKNCLPSASQYMERSKKIDRDGTCYHMAPELNSNSTISRPVVRHTSKFCAVITPSSQDHLGLCSCAACAEFVDLDTMYNFGGRGLTRTDDFDNILCHTLKHCEAAAVPK